MRKGLSMNEGKIAFLTYVKNGEKYLAKSIECVLAQTHTNLIYYLVDNQSTDNTFEIMMDYAQKDSRISVFKGDNTMNVLTDYIDIIEDCEYFALLDGDDLYEPEFAAKMIDFIEKEQLDFACCTSKFIDVVTEATANRGFPYEAIFEAPQFVEQLPNIFSVLRTIWGKVFKLSLLKSLDISDFQQFSSKTFLAVDTVYVLSALRRAQRIGFLPEVLHTYFIIPSSVSKRYDPYSLDATVHLFHVMESFHPKISLLIWFYLIEITVIIKNLFASNLTLDEKLNEMMLIGKHPLTQRYIEIDPELQTKIVAPLFKAIKENEGEEQKYDFDKCLKVFKI